MKWKIDNDKLGSVQLAMRNARWLAVTIKKM